MGRNKIAELPQEREFPRRWFAEFGFIQAHVTKVERVFQSCGQKAKGQTCQATVGLLAEGDEIAADFKGSPAINAALISASQKVEHHEMAAYGCLHEWAGLLGNVPAAGLIQEILDEEKAANDKLTELARAANNKEALCDCTENGSKAATSNTKPSSLRRGIRPAGIVRMVGKILTR